KDPGGIGEARRGSGEGRQGAPVASPFRHRPSFRQGQRGSPATVLRCEHAQADTGEMSFRALPAGTRVAPPVGGMRPIVPTTRAAALAVTAALIAPSVRARAAGTPATLAQAAANGASADACASFGAALDPAEARFACVKDGSAAWAAWIDPPPAG